MKLKYTAVDKEGRTATHEIPDDGSRVLQTSNRAVLIQRPDGAVYCSCPYLCLATSERCEFKSHA